MSDYEPALVLGTVIVDSKELVFNYITNTTILVTAPLIWKDYITISVATSGNYLINIIKLIIKSEQW